MKKVRVLLAGLFLIPMFSFVVAQITPVTVGAQPQSMIDGATSAKVAGAPEELDGDSGVVTKIINLFLYIIGILAVIMLIFGGFQYLTSAGNTEKVTKAKNTILYAVIGLVIAIFAYALVNWVLTNVGGSGA